MEGVAGGGAALASSGVIMAKIAERPASSLPFIGICLYIQSLMF